MDDHAGQRLLPPAATLLEYAAYGWSAHLGNFTAAGRPRLPDPGTWLLEFAALLAAPDGLEWLERLTLAGMEAWGVDASIRAVVPAAFCSPGLLDRLAALYPGPLPIIPTALMAAPDPASPPAGSKPAPPSPAPPATSVVFPAPATVQKFLPAPKAERPKRRNRKVEPGPG